jgi:hypothetical protein
MRWRQAGDSLVRAASATGGLRVVENGVGISCAPSRSGWPCCLEADQLATAGRRLFGAGRERPAHRPAHRSAPRSWHRRIGRDPHSPYALRRRTGRGRRPVRQCSTAPGVGAVGGGPTRKPRLPTGGTRWKRCWPRPGTYRTTGTFRPDRGAGHPQRGFRTRGPRITSGSTAPASSTWIRGRHGAASLPAARRCCRSRPATAR